VTPSNADGWGPQQVDEGQRLRLVAVHAGVKLDGLGTFPELVSAFGVEPVKRISD
jgi:hypothetical protein